MSKFGFTVDATWVKLFLYHFQCAVQPQNDRQSMNDETGNWKKKFHLQIQKRISSSKSKKKKQPIGVFLKSHFPLITESNSDESVNPKKKKNYLNKKKIIL